MLSGQRIIPLFIICVFACSAAAQDKALDTLQIIKANGERLHYRIELADTEALRRKGLMYRRSLPPEHGMLLVYPQAQRVAIWMKNTYIPLDLLYIDQRGEITQIRPDAIPHDLTSLPSHAPTLAVLELNAGEAARQAIKVGDKVVHPLFAN